MKKALFAVLTLSVCILLFSACTKQNDNNSLDNTNEYEETEHDDFENKKTIVSGFSEFLDRERLVPGIMQHEFYSGLENYFYQGEKITEIMHALFYDSESGGGMLYSGELFGFCNDYTASDDKMYADYSNSFYTNTALRGLTLPYGIDFNDKLANALAKIGIDKNIIYENNSGSDTEITLYSNGKSTLIYKNLKNGNDISGATRFSEELIYCENYRIEYVDRREGTVTRTVTMSFLENNGKLGCIKMSVKESYPRKVK